LKRVQLFKAETVKKIGFELKTKEKRKREEFTKKV
jgi:hypothetical protein